MIAIARFPLDDSLGGQARALAHFAQIPPFLVSRHLAAETNSGVVILAKLCEDCGQCPGDCDCLTEQVLLHFRSDVPLENCAGSRNQTQGDGRGDVTGGNVGIKAEIRQLGVFSICWPDTFSLHIRVDSTPWNSWNSAFMSSSSWFWISRPRDSSVVANSH